MPVCASPRTTLRRLLGLATGAAMLASFATPAVATHTARAPGDEAWVSIWHGTQRNSTEEALAVTTNPDGTRVFAAGYSASSRGEFAVLAYRARTGERVWHASYPFPHGWAISYVEDIAVSPDGARVVVSVELLGWDQRMTAVAFDARTGAPQWFWAYPDTSSATGLAVGGGKVVLVGAAEPKAAHGRDHVRVLAALRLMTGEPAWVRVLRPSQGGKAFGSAAAIAGGRVFTSTSVQAPGGDYLRTSANALGDGTPVWSDTVNGLSYGDVAGVSADGATLVVGGTRWGTTSIDRWRAVTYDTTTGERTSLATVDPAWEGDVWTMTTDPGATALVLGGDRYTSEEDAGVAAIDLATGVVSWSAFSDGGGSDGVIDLVASPTRPIVYAAAYEEVDARFAWHTWALDLATGAEAWSAEYGVTPAARSGFPRAIAIGPSGTRLYVAGYTDLWRANDFVTVAYEA